MIAALSLSGCRFYKAEDATKYIQEEYDKDGKKKPLFAADLCILPEKDSKDVIDAGAHATGLFSLHDKKTLQSFKGDEQLFPASTTKIMTALLAVKSGKLDETVTVSKYAVEELEEGSSVCDLHVGDKLTLRDLLYGLLLESGNDAAVAIAEFLGGGSEMDFVTKMNDQAQKLGATHTHFVNSHGLHDSNHYTTEYDLYLMFNEALKSEDFKTIIECKEYNTSITASDGTMRSVSWKPTNYYASGDAQAPRDVTVIGGKTGTTDEAGSCLVLYSRNKGDHPFISIVMGAASKPVLYSDMNELLAMENK